MQMTRIATDLALLTSTAVGQGAITATSYLERMCNLFLALGELAATCPEVT